MTPESIVANNSIILSIFVVYGGCRIGVFLYVNMCSTFIYKECRKMYMILYIDVVMP